jgi:hypothetical protein
MPLTPSIEFVLTQEAVNFLKLITGPVGLVAVAGMYRTGKSYLLNRMLLNRSDGFGVGPTINPCTKVSTIQILTANRDSGFGANLLQASLQKASQSMCSSWTQKASEPSMRTQTMMLEYSL